MSQRPDEKQNGAVRAISQSAYWANGIATLYQADARSLPLPDASVDTVVTSPPYFGLRDYQSPGQIGLEASVEDYVCALVAVFRELWRVLKPQGTAWLNLGDSYNGSGGAGGDYGANGLKEGQPKYPGRNVSQLKPKDLIGIPWRVAFALQSDGWYLRSDIVWSKPAPMPESVTDRPTKAHEYVFLLTKQERYYYDSEAIKERSEWNGESGTKNYLAWAENGRIDAGMNSSGPSGFRNRRSVWEISTRPYAEAHFAVFPEALVEPCVLAGSPKDGTVLDPFAGSGTTLAVAQRLGRHSVGVDISGPYLELARKRLEAVTLPMAL